MFGATNIVKNSDKEKWVYSGYRIGFDGAGSCTFGNEFARKVAVFGVGYSSSSHLDNRKNNFLVLSEGPTYGIDGSLVQQRNNLLLILIKQTQNLASFCIIMVIIVICLLMEEKSLSLKLITKILAF